MKWQAEKLVFFCHSYFSPACLLDDSRTTSRVFSVTVLGLCLELVRSKKSLAASVPFHICRAQQRSIDLGYSNKIIGFNP